MNTLHFETNFIMGWCNKLNLCFDILGIFHTESKHDLKLGCQLGTSLGEYVQAYQSDRNLVTEGSLLEIYL